MPCPHLVAAACVVTLVGSAALSAQAPLPTTQRPAVAEAAVPMKAFSRLFEQQGSEAATALRAKMRQNFARPNSARRFICGMPVLPWDPTIDRAFEVPLPATATRFTMRVIAPPCR